MIKTLQTWTVDLCLLEQDHILTRKKKQEKNMALWKQTIDNVLRLFTETLLATNFIFKTGLDYEIKQLSERVLQFTKLFAIYFIFKNSRM